MKPMWIQSWHPIVGQPFKADVTGCSQSPPCGDVLLRDLEESCENDELLSWFSGMVHMVVPNITKPKEIPQNGIALLTNAKTILPFHFKQIMIQNANKASSLKNAVWVHAGCTVSQIAFEPNCKLDRISYGYPFPAEIRNQKQIRRNSPNGHPRPPGSQGAKSQQTLAALKWRCT